MSCDLHHALCSYILISDISLTPNHTYTHIANQLCNNIAMLRYYYKSLCRNNVIPTHITAAAWIFAGSPSFGKFLSWNSFMNLSTAACTLHKENSEFKWSLIRALCLSFIKDHFTFYLNNSLSSTSDLQPSSYSHCETTAWPVSFYTN